MIRVEQVRGEASECDTGDVNVRTVYSDSNIFLMYVTECQPARRPGFSVDERVLTNFVEICSNNTCIITC